MRSFIARARLGATFVASLLAVFAVVGTASAQEVCVSAPMGSARYLHSATVLADGKVLVAGGMNDAGALASAELYDPVANTWSAAGSLATARLDHTATLLADGQVLVVGGIDGFTYVATAELYNPPTNSWSTVPSAAINRFRHTATTLPDGTVLLAGGLTGPAQGPFAFAPVEIFDPVAGTLTAAAQMAAPRQLAAAALVGGKVVVSGGYASVFLDVPAAALASAESFDPATGTWSPAAALDIAKVAHSATSLGANVLIAGGNVAGAAGVDFFDPTRQTASVAFYDPATGATAAAALAAPRFSHSASLLASGKVLVAGGYGGVGFLASTELYDARANDAPVAGADSAASAGANVVINVLANDTDANPCDTISLAGVGAAANGATAIIDTVNNFTPKVQYTPNVGFNGVDSFTYTIKDSRGATATGTVTVTVGTPKPPKATGVLLSADKASPQVFGTAVVFTAQGQGSTGYQYRFFVSSDNRVTWNLVQDWSAAATYTLPGTTPVGIHAVAVHVRTDPTSPARDAQTSMTFQITSAPRPKATGVLLSADKASPQAFGTPVVFTAQGQGSTGYQYRFFVSSDNRVTWRLVQDWSDAATYTLPGTTPVGTHAIAAHVRTDVTSQARDAQTSMTYVIVP